MSVCVCRDETEDGCAMIKRRRGVWGGKNKKEKVSKGVFSMKKGREPFFGVKPKKIVSENSR